MEEKFVSLEMLNLLRKPKILLLLNMFLEKKNSNRKKEKITDKGKIKLSGCTGNNLKNVDLEIPLGI